MSTLIAFLLNIRKAHPDDFLSKSKQTAKAVPPKPAKNPFRLFREEKMETLLAEGMTSREARFEHSYLMREENIVFAFFSTYSSFKLYPFCFKSILFIPERHVNMHTRS